MRQTTVDLCCFLVSALLFVLLCFVFFMRYLASHLFLAGSFVSLRSLLKCHLLREGIGDHSAYCALSTLYSPLLFYTVYLAFLFSVCLEKVTFNDFGGRGKYPNLRRPEKMPWPRTQKSPQSCFFLSSCTGLISLLTKHTCCEYLSACLELLIPLPLT